MCWWKKAQKVTDITHKEREDKLVSFCFVCCVCVFFFFFFALK